MKAKYLKRNEVFFLFLEPLWGQPSVNGINAFWNWCCISSVSRLLHTTKLFLLHHFTVFSPTGPPVCLVMFLALIMRVQINELALFLQSNYSVNSQQVYLACRIWKDKYIKHRNFESKYCSEGLTSGYPWERGSRKVALPTFFLLLLIEHWNNCWVFFEKWLKVFVLRCRQLRGPRCINNCTSTLSGLVEELCVIVFIGLFFFFFQSNISCVTSAAWSCRLGTTHDSCSEDMYSTLLQRYHQLEQEMGQVAEAWLECQKRIDDYVDEQVRTV